MAKSQRAYKGEKRKKEIARQKKKEEKMKRRLNKRTDAQDTEKPEAENKGTEVEG